jgi:hypothetical protein
LKMTVKIWDFWENDPLSKSWQRPWNLWSTGIF